VPTPDLTQEARIRPAGWFLHGQCRLEGGPFDPTLVLRPHGGSYLYIDRLPRIIPPFGVGLVVTGLTPLQWYFIYARWIDDGGGLGHIDLIADTQDHVTEPDLGIEVATHNPRWTLVGQAFIEASGATWQQSLSWFNRRKKTISKLALDAITFSNTTPAEASAGLRVTFITWGGATVIAAGSVSQNTAGATVAVGVAFNQTNPAHRELRWVPSANTEVGAMTLNYEIDGLSEGFLHFATVIAYVSAGQGTLVGINTTDPRNWRLTVEVEG
jgi:hypothetical protein